MYTAQVQSSEWLSQLYADANTMPATVFLSNPSYDNAGVHLYRAYHSSDAQNSGFRNSEVDRLLEQQRHMLDPQLRLPVLRHVQELVWQEQVHVYLMHPSNIWGQRKGVTGFRVLPGNSVLPTAATSA